ncbi:MAG: hypothetical protein AB9844_02650 [Clostridiaceae bacterium]
MEIHVKDNAINSLKVGLNFYTKFVNNLDNVDVSISHYGNLKFAVVAIHNSIELLTKAILLDINEFLVFESNIENDEIVCKLLREQYNNKKMKAHLAYHAVFSENSYKTIDYAKSIKLLQKIFSDEIHKADFETLYKISEYRNTLTHLGYASTFEWYKILIVINQSLDLIIKFYKKNMMGSKDYFTKSLINRIKIILMKSKEHIIDIWKVNSEIVLEDINDKIDLFFSNELGNREFVDIDNEYNLYQKINFNFNNENLMWEFQYSYLNNAIIIVDENSLIIGCISLDDINLIFNLDIHGMPQDLKEAYIFVLKGNEFYNVEKIYNINDKSKFIKFILEPKQFSPIINLYLEKINKYPIENL